MPWSGLRCTHSVAFSPHSAYHQDCHVPRAPAPGEGEGSSWVCRQCVFAIATKVKAPLCLLVWEPPVTSPPSLPSEASLFSSAEGRCPEEGSLCPGHAGHETLPAVRSERAGLGRRTSEQQAAELLLLRGPGGVSEGRAGPATGCFVVVEPRTEGNEEGEGGALWFEEG